MKKHLIAGAVALAACGAATATVGAQGSPAPPTLAFDISASAIQLEGTPAIKTGYHRLQFTNARRGEAGVALVELKPGVTVEQFGPAVAKLKDPTGVKKFGRIVASTFLMPKGEYATTIKLADADYALVDLTKRPAVKVSFHAGPEADAVAAPAAPDVDVKLGDYAFSMPKTLRSGKQVMRVANVGDELHHALVMPLRKGVKDAKVLADLKRGKEPRNAIGGPPSALVEVVSPETTNDVEMNLRKGKYLVVCFLQDTPTSKPHAMLGMRKIVTVK